jgi:hypothetical protein
MTASELGHAEKVASDPGSEWVRLTGTVYLRSRHRKDTDVIGVASDMGCLLALSSLLPVVKIQVVGRVPLRRSFCGWTSGRIEESMLDGKTN